MINAASTAIRSPFAPRPDLIVTFRAMASDVTLRVCNPGPKAAAAVVQAQQLFETVHATCTRFDPQSSLMQANAAATEWAVVEPECFQAIGEAFAAYRRTDGAFDPRVLRALVRAGYDAGMTFTSSTADSTPTPETTNVAAAVADPAVGEDTDPRLNTPGATADWTPEFDTDRSAVRIGPDPIDLGGIGKGLSVRWAADLLQGVGTSFLVEAGGDCYAGGAGPQVEGWRIAVEDPFGESEPRAVLALKDLGCATSSIRIRHWVKDGKPVHHIIDPRTGAAGGSGLQAVTVVGPDPADAEVWSKTLFLAGIEGIADLATRHDLAALWIGSDGATAATSAMEQHIIWERPHA